MNHLKPGTRKDNSKDMYQKGRGKNQFKNGEKHISSKLTNKEVKEIKELIKTGMSNIDIAKKYNTKNYNISKIKNGQRWNHIL